MRSAAFSLGAMALIIILGLLIRPTEFVTLINSLTKPISWYLTIGSWLLVTLWIPWSILVDYFSLFKTRIILRILTRLKGSSIFAIVILLVDYYAYLLLYIFGQGFAFNSYIYIHYSRSDPDYINLSYLFSTIFNLAGIFNAITQPELPIVWFSNDPLDNMFSTFFWAGFAPSIWMWLYVAALFVTLGLLRSEKLVNWLRWFLDVEKAPFRSIGAVAATLAFIASVAIIFVSAEVSRISAAS